MTNDWLKWIVGVLVSLALSVAGYSINVNIQNEKRITQIETELSQARGELDDFWVKYNHAQEKGLEWSKEVTGLEYRLMSVEKDVNELRGRRRN